MVKLYRQGHLAPENISLSEAVKEKVEDIFLGGGISGRLRERISPPHTFPVDTAGKDTKLSRPHHLYHLGKLRFKTCLFREIDMDPGSALAVVTRRLFATVVLPIMLVNGKWEGVEAGTDWLRHLRADILTSKIIRHIMRKHDARAFLCPDDGRTRYPKKFTFPDNDSLVS